MSRASGPVLPAHRRGRSWIWPSSALAQLNWPPRSTARRQEGLRTLLLDAVAADGQAAASSRIENYLGFTSGISGAELTGRAERTPPRRTRPGRWPPPVGVSCPPIRPATVAADSAARPDKELANMRIPAMRAPGNPRAHARRYTGESAGSNPRLLPTVIALSYRLLRIQRIRRRVVIYYFRLQDRSDGDLTVVLGQCHSA